jgi:PEP-CTERM motif
MKVSTTLCALIGLGVLSCIPSFADTATFSVSATGSISFGTVQNVVYSLLSPSPVEVETTNRLAGLTYIPSTFSLNSGTLSYRFGPVTGWASTPAATPPNLNSSSSSYFADDQFYVDIQNNNNFSVTIPVVASLITYSGTATSEGLVNGYFQQFSTSADYEAFVEAIFQPALGLPATLYVGAFCQDTACASFTSQDQSTAQSGAPIVSDSSLLIPANTSYVVETIAGVRGDAYAYTIPETPEPGTFVLLGSGMLGLIAVNRRRIAGGLNRSMQHWLAG